MFVASLTDEELETVILALRYWRYHRRGGETRKHDRVLTSAELDTLVAKMGTGRLSSFPPEDDMTTDLFSR